MKYLATALAIAGIFSLLVLAACGGNGPAVTSERGDGSGAGESGGEHSEGSESGESNKESGEHSNESELGEHGDGGELEGESEAGEESGTQYGVNETYDEVRAGARLIISYDAQQQLQRLRRKHYQQQTDAGTGRSSPVQRHRAGADSPG